MRSQTIMLTERVTPVTETEVVRLAIALAQLRGVKEPASFLDEAARLLTEARFALSRELKRPEREAKEQSEHWVRLITNDLSAQRVPFAKLCRPATDEEKLGASALPAVESFGFRGESGMVQFEWRVYRDERDFKELLEKHANRIYEAKLICEAVADELARLKKVAEYYQQEAKNSGQPANTEATQNIPSWGHVAAHLFAHRFWFPADWRDKFLAVGSSEAGAMVAKEYVKAAIPAVREYFWKLAKADHIDSVTLFSIHQTRLGTYRTRGPKRPPNEQGNV